MNRAELALAILDRLEERFPGLIHPWGPRGHEVYDDAKLAEIFDEIDAITTPWSKRQWLCGVYKDDSQSEAEP